MTINREHRIIKQFETMTPEEVIYELSFRTGYLKDNLETISHIRKYNLPNGVMNVLIHLTFFNCDGGLPLEFMEKVAEDWLSKRIRTVKAACEISKTLHMKYKEWTINAKKEVDHNQATKVNEVEETRFNAIKIAANCLEISDKDLGKFVRNILRE